MASNPRVRIPPTEKLFVNMTTACQLLDLTRFELWTLMKRWPGEAPILVLGRRKRLVDIHALKAWIESKFPRQAAVVRRGRGRPRKTEAVPAEAVRA